MHDLRARSPRSGSRSVSRSPRRRAARSRRSRLLVVGAGWPATLLSDGHDLLRGAVILAAALLLLAGLRAGRRRTLARAAPCSAAPSSPPRSPPRRSRPSRRASSSTGRRGIPTRARRAAVGVRYVWDANYDGFTLAAQDDDGAEGQGAGALPLLARDDARPVQRLTLGREPQPHPPALFDGRLDLTQDDPLAPAAARDPQRWSKSEVEIEALADNHLVAPSVPVGYEPEFGGAVLAGRRRHALARARERRPLSGLELLARTRRRAQLASAKRALSGRGAARTSRSRPGDPRRRRSARRPRLRRMARFLFGSIATTARCTRRHAASSAARAAPTAPRSRSSPGCARPAASATRRTRPGRGRSRSLDFVIRHEARLLPALRRRDGADAALPRDSLARRGGLRQRHVRREHADVDGHRPRRARLGRGLVRRLRLAAVRPDARPRLRSRRPYSISSPRFPSRSGGGHRRRGRRGAAQHGGDPPGSRLRGQGLGRVPRHGHPARASPGRAARSASSSAAAASASCSRSLLALVVALLARREGGAQAPALRDAGPAPAGAACRADLRDFLADQGIRPPAERRAADELASLLQRAARGRRRPVRGRARRRALRTAARGADGRGAARARSSTRAPGADSPPASASRGGCAGSSRCARSASPDDERVVMAAGEGTRLRPITERWPKPVLPIDGRPVVATLLRELGAAGCDRVTVVTGHLAEQVEALLGDGSALRRRASPTCASPGRRIRRRRSPRARGRRRRAGPRRGRRPRRSRREPWRSSCANGAAPPARSRRAAARTPRRRPARAARSREPDELTSVPLWGIGAEVVRFLDDLPGPPYELADAFGRALDGGLEVRGVVVPGTRDLTHPVDLIRQNFPYLSR